MPGILNEHNPEIRKNAPYIRVIHLRNNKGSLYLNDLDGGDNVYSQYKIPVYIPFGKVIDIPLVDRTLTSYQQGAIRAYAEKGLLAAFILSNREVVQANIGEIYTVDLLQDLVLVDTSSGAAVVNLPNSLEVPEGFKVTIKKTTSDLNQIQVLPTSGDDIDGASFLLIDGDQEAVTLERGESGDWWVLSKADAVSGGGGGPTTLTKEASVSFSGTGDLTPSASSTLSLSRQFCVGGVGTLSADAFIGGRVRRDYLLTQDISVPKSGILYLKYDNITTSSIPIEVNKDLRLTSALVRVNVSDTDDYELQILDSGTLVESISLPAGNLSARRVGMQGAFLDGSEVEARISRVGGTEKSDFSSIMCTLEFAEDD